MTTPIYISASSAEWRRAKRWADALLDTGLAHFADPWWELGAETWSGRDHFAPQEAVDSAVYAHDLAITGCEVFWLLAPTLYSHGACQELGYARASRSFRGRLRIYVSGAHFGSSIFWRDQQHELVADSDQAAFDAIVASLRGRT